MAQTVIPFVNFADRERLAAVVEDRNRPQKHVQRARIILLSAERLTVLEVAARSGASRPSVWRWQRRFAEEGVAGLLRDKTRKPGRAALPPASIAKILALPCGKPPKAATHWTGRMVAKAVGVSLSAVQRIWQAHRLQPHRIRTFKKSNDPAFAIRRGVFTSVANLQDAIRGYIREHNRDPKPFVWTKPADLIRAKLSRLPGASV